VASTPRATWPTKQFLPRLTTSRRGFHGQKFELLASDCNGHTRDGVLLFASLFSFLPFNDYQNQKHDCFDQIIPYLLDSTPLNLSVPIT
jgi:hypothetical protein